MRYEIILDIRGMAETYHVHAMLPKLAIRDETPLFRQAKPNYVPTESTRFELTGVVSASELIELTSAIEFIGSAFESLRMRPA